MKGSVISNFCPGFWCVLLIRASLPLAPSVVWLPLQRGCWRTQYKEVVWTKVLVDLVGNFCSFSESKRTETSLAAFRFSTSIQFTRSPIPNTRTRTYSARRANRAALHSM